MWPLVVTELGDDMTDDDTVRLLQLYEGVLSRRARFVGLVDLSAMKRPPGARQRQLIAAWSEKNLLLNQQFNMGSAIVVPNAMVRGALTALGWLFRSPIAQSFEPTIPRAVDWCVQRMNEVALPVPAGLRTMKASKP
jgi:hypothetical protein